MLKSQVSVLLTALSVVASIGCGPGEPGGPPEFVVPERAGVLTEATTYYGPLIVSEGEFLEQSTVRPWSSFWYPIGDNILVVGSDRNGGQSTLDKYDKYSAKVFNRNATSVSFEIAKGHYDPDAGGSEGRCNAWAIAALMEPEPRLPPSGVEVGGIRFFTRDVKALLIKSYEEIDAKAVMRFGRRYNGERGDQLDDIYPDQFHRVVQAEIFEKKRPIMMDTDEDMQVWNAPFWQAQFKITRDGSNPNLLHVQATLKGAKSTNVDPDYAGPSQNFLKEYTYDLMGIPREDGTFEVKYGEWTGRSLDDHPDFVTALPEKDVVIEHRSSNKQLDLNVIKDILEKTGAFRRG